jgi:hypothetical protein
MGASSLSGLAKKRLSVRLMALAQALLTVLIGAATFAVGQIIVKLCDPIFELRALFGEIARDMLLYANRDDKIAGPKKRLLIFRSLSGALHEKVQKVVWYPVFSLFKILPAKKDVRKAAGLLISLSNSQIATDEELLGYQPWNTMNFISKLLKLKLTEQEKPKRSG